MISSDTIREYLKNHSDKSPAEIRDIIIKEHDVPSSYHATLHSNIRTIKVRPLKRSGHSALEEECENVGIPLENVGNYWHKGKHFSIHVKKDVVDFTDKIEAIVSKYVPKSNIQLKQRKDVGEKALKITLSDMHVGLDPDPNGTGLFRYDYNSEIFFNNLDKVFNSAMKEFNTHGPFEVIYLDDLGDGLDGWNAETTRGGHKLDQNMTNECAFETYLEGKIKLLEMLISSGMANKVVSRSVTNDNHSGSFSWMANFSIQKILERTYGNTVDFYILERFMEHFEYGDHTYILSHGKDRKYMKFGLPLYLNEKTINLIRDYIKHYNITSKYIHVEKGDLHQIGYQRTKEFDYRNFMSFAPPSNWVQHNFSDSYSGFSIQVIPKSNNEISHMDYILEFDKV